jgi:hypothetical protein
MKLLTMHKIVVLGAVVVLAACSNGSGGNSGGSSGSSSSGSGSGSSGGSGSGSGSSSGSGSGSGSSSGSEGGALPTIKIATPATGSSVAVVKNGAEEDIPVTFTLTNFTLMAAGSCGSISTTCGHIHLLIDDATSCGAPPYNVAIESGTSGNAVVSKCSTVNGAHKIILELHDDQHNPINGANGQVISDSVQLTVTGG